MPNDSLGSIKVKFRPYDSGPPRIREALVGTKLPFKEYVRTKDYRLGPDKLPLLGTEGVAVPSELLVFHLDLFTWSWFWNHGRIGPGKIIVFAREEVTVIKEPSSVLPSTSPPIAA